MTPTSLCLGLGLVLLALFVYVSARTFIRSWRYREALKDEVFRARDLDDVLATAATGDLAFFTASAHPFHNSWVNQTLFTHVGVLVRGKDLLAAGTAELPVIGGPVDPLTLYVAECAEGIPLAGDDPTGERHRLPGGSYIVPFFQRLQGYNGLVYHARGRRSSEAQSSEALAIAKRAVEAAGKPYPGRWAMIYAALLGVNISPHRQCYQHAAFVLNAVADPPFPEEFFKSPEGMDAAALGKDERFQRAAVVGKRPTRE